jgi:hypothetical protein
VYDSIWLRREDLLRVHTSQFVLLNASIWDFWALITQILSCSSLSLKTMHWWVDRVRRCKRSWLWIIEVNYELPAHTHSLTLAVWALTHSIFDQAPCRLAKSEWRSDEGRRARKFHFHMHASLFCVSHLIMHTSPHCFSLGHCSIKTTPSHLGCSLLISREMGEWDESINRERERDICPQSTFAA